MMKDRKYPRIGVAVMVVKNRKVLLGKRRNAHGEGSWAFPGGHLEWNESIEDCAAREVREETGLRIKEIRFQTITNDRFRREGKHYVTLFVKAKYDSGRVTVKEPHKCERWEWFSWDELPYPRFLPLANLLRQGYRPL